MDKQTYIKSCLQDAISALDVQYPAGDNALAIPVGKDFIYPKIAIERIRSAMNADNLPCFKEKNNG